MAAKRGKNGEKFNQMSPLERIETVNQITWLKLIL